MLEMAKKIELKKLRDPKTDQQNPHIYALLCPLEKTNTCTYILLILMDIT